MTFVLGLIAAFSWGRFLWLGLTHQLTDQSVGIPLLWTILAVVA